MKAKPNYKLHVAGFSMQIVFAFILVFISVRSFSQAESPYSIYGLGALRSPVFSANQAMGYLSAPYASGVNINYSNPASYASLSRTTIDIGVLIDGNHIAAGGDSSYRSANGSVDHFAIALAPSPFSKHQGWGICLGMVPYSNVNYNYVENFNDNSIGPYSESFIGSGSLYNAFVGGAYKVKGFSIGANLGFLFGKLQYQKVISFPQDSFASYATQNITNVNVKGFNYNVGLQYQVLIYHSDNDPDQRKDVYAFFGAYGATSLKMNAKVTSFWDRSVFSPSTSTQVVIDTLQSQALQLGKITVPYNVGAGVMFGNERTWMWGLDAKYNGWGSFNTILDNGGLVNSWQVSTGGQLTPKFDDRNYLLRMQYRAGAYYGKSEISFGGSQLTQAGATLGLGFPFKTFAHINVAGDFGSLGNAGNTAVLQQTYYRLTIGFVLNDIWFNKRKFE